jgi:hypothetical protein
VGNGQWAMGNIETRTAIKDGHFQAFLADERRGFYSLAEYNRSQLPIISYFLTALARGF